MEIGSNSSTSVAEVWAVECRYDEERERVDENRDREEIVFTRGQGGVEVEVPVEVVAEENEVEVEWLFEAVEDSWITGSPSPRWWEGGAKPGGSAVKERGRTGNIISWRRKATVNLALHADVRSRSHTFLKNLYTTTRFEDPRALFQQTIPFVLRYTTSDTRDPDMIESVVQEWKCLEPSVGWKYKWWVLQNIGVQKTYRFPWIQLTRPAMYDGKRDRLGWIPEAASNPVKWQSWGSTVRYADI
jgi:hypothetical protein